MKFTYEDPVWLDKNENEPETETEQEKKERLHKEIEERLRASVTALIESRKYFLGEGMTAEVHSLEGNPNLCFKIIRNIDVMAREDAVQNLSPEHRKIYDKKKEENDRRKAGKKVDEIPWHVDLFSEAQFLKKARESSRAAIVPKPYMHITTTGVEEGEGCEVRDEVSIMLMDRLKAVSIDNLIKGQFIPPDGFEYSKFCEKVRQFISDIHENHLYHRDLHGGNVMIDLDTGDPCVIDFGRSNRSSEEDAYNETPVPGKKIQFLRTDEELFGDTAKSLRAYLEYRGVDIK